MTSAEVEFYKRLKEIKFPLSDNNNNIDKIIEYNSNKSEDNGESTEY